MKIINCEQGSPEWFNARCGVITASMFSECRKKLKSGPNKGDYTKAAHEYAFRLAVERISGELLSEDKFDTWEMRRGRELEPDARLLHETTKGVLVEQTGFVTTDDSKFGVSVDGMIDDDGISEYKCFVAPSSMMPILLNDNIDNCIDQVQGGLWITGKKFAHFVLYCPALKSIGKDLKVIEVERDENYIEALESDLWQYNTLVDKYEYKLRA